MIHHGTLRYLVRNSEQGIIFSNGHSIGSLGIRSSRTSSHLSPPFVRLRKSGSVSSKGIATLPESPQASSIFRSAVVLYLPSTRTAVPVCRSYKLTSMRASLALSTGRVAGKVARYVGSIGKGSSGKVVQLKRCS